MYLGTNSCICITFDKFYELHDQTNKYLVQFCIFFKLHITPQPLYNTIVRVQTNFSVSFSICIKTRVKCIDK